MTAAKYEEALATVQEVIDSGSGNQNALNGALAEVLIEQASDIAGLASTGLGGTVTVEDGGGSLTVDGTVAISGAVPVTDNAGSLTVDDGGGSLTVDDGAGSISVDDNGGAISVDDNGGSLTVDGTVAVSSVGDTVAVSAASLPLPTGAATSANQTSELSKLDQLHTDLTGTLTVGLPSGAATAANQSTANTSLSSINTKLGAATTGAASLVALTATSATLLASNSNRIWALIHNPLSVAIYVRFENADAVAVPSIVIQPGDAYELPKYSYTGAIRAATASGSGNVYVTEFT